MKRPSATRAQVTAPTDRDKVAMFYLLLGFVGIFGTLPVMIAYGCTVGCVVGIVGFCLMAHGADVANGGGK